ncbi:MAG TPA: efflux RND transporter periplasmic adaptor subunit [Anaerolineales bacterium]|nr:efflux RND transporter periplasmic adaptor subunit [Anaerolineales bacterium]
MNTKHFRKSFWLAIVPAVIISACSIVSPQATPTEAPVEIEDFPALVSATGIVVPAQWTRLSLPSSGIIEEILVQEGSLVQDGQLLLRLKGQEDIQAAISMANFELISAQKALDDLSSNTETARNQALESIAVFAQQVRDAQYQLDNFTIPANQSGLDPLEALDLMEQNLEQARQDFEPFKTKPSSDATRQDKKEILDHAQSDYNAAVRRLEYQIQVDVAKANLEKARQDHEIWSQGPKPADVAVSQARLENAQAALASAQARLTNLELRSPFTGTISKIYAREGEWISPGSPVFLLADLAHLRIETTDLNEIDAARVALQDQVSITFDALPDVVLEGIIDQMSPMASEGSGVNYTAIINMMDWPEELRWGMTAFVDIYVD